METSTKTINYKSILQVGVLLVLLLVSLNYISGELKYFELGKKALGRFFGVRWWLVGHLVCGILALVLGPIQFWTAFRIKYPKLHRKIGKVYILAIVLGAISSTYLAWTAAIMVHFTWALGLQVIAVVWLTTVFMAYRTIKLKRIQRHKEWMIRSYIVSFVFVWFRFLNDVLADVGTFQERAATIGYLSAFAPLFIAEVIFQWDRE